MGNAGEGCHGFALATGTEDQDFGGWVFFDGIWFDEGIFWDLDIAQFDPVCDGLFHGPAKDSNLASGFHRSVCSLLETENVGGKGGKDDAAMDAFDDFGDGLADDFF